MNSIEDYQNLIEVLKQALLFYANSANYIGLGYKGINSHEFVTQIELDRGSQAKFALQKIEEIEKTYEKMRTEYLDELKYDNDIDTAVKNSEELLKTLNNFKNTINNENIH